MILHGHGNTKVEMMKPRNHQLKSPHHFVPGENPVQVNEQGSTDRIVLKLVVVLRNAKEYPVPICTESAFSSVMSADPIGCTVVLTPCV